ncbi:MAG: two-component regulator propeller domain-containing protein [Acidobacteriota bacterium]|nr:hypothetical protein [Blastocatellia bacterium]MDW8411517.1 two-component regulator propeller domain-containing protein [Acidobacteriota bacterium]
MKSFLLLLLACGVAAAQGFYRLTSEQGLASNSVYSIVRDRYGLVWIGTDDGLSLYDGKEFTSYEHVYGEQYTLSSSHIRVVYDDRSGTIWAGTERNGLNRFDRVSKRFFSYQKKQRHAGSISSDLVRAIYQTSDGTLWIGTVGGGVNRFDRHKGRFAAYYFIDPKTTPGKIANTVNCLLEDNSARLWIGTATGLFLYNKDEDRVLPVTAGEQVAILSMQLDPNGQLWLGLAGAGLMKFDPDSRAFSKLNSLGNEDISTTTFTALYFAADKRWYATADCKLYMQVGSTVQKYDLSKSSADTIRCIYGDSEGRVWIGTDCGVVVYDPYRMPFTPLRGDTQIELKKVRAILEDSNKRLWIGTMDGQLACYSESNRRWEARSLPVSTIYALLEDSNGDIWVGTNLGAYVLDARSGAVKQKLDVYAGETVPVWAIAETAEGIWLGSNGRGIAVYNAGALKWVVYDPTKKGTLSSNNVTCIYKDRSNTIWIGTADGGLNKYDPATDTFKSYRYDASGYSLSSDSIYCILEDSRGRFWIGTYGDGLNLFDPGAETSVVYTTQDGLPSNTVVALAEDAAGFIWAATLRGLVRIDPVRRIFSTYDAKDGLQNDRFNIGAVYKTADGELLFGGVDGYNRFDPKQIPARPLPSVVIKDVVVVNSYEKSRALLAQVFGKAQDLVVLSYWENSVAVEFIAVDYTRPDKVTYAYMLEGVDTDWKYTKNRYLSYGVLDGGKYLLRIRAAGADGVWGNSVEIRFRVTAPPWKTWWAYCLYVALFVLAVRAFKRRLSS